MLKKLLLYFKTAFMGQDSLSGSTLTYEDGSDRQTNDLGKKNRQKCYLCQGVGVIYNHSSGLTRRGSIDRMYQSYTPLVERRTCHICKGTGYINID